ncbi:STAS domain-containing protein [Aquincola sp. S2]|uniref:STAS domain-containing protein n=1 Tax=Pseudaquabacterium terrae TaxID=2732868 RepID=A0ABX2EBV9_9BURK|nr:STAS domain-containing protein [Aquabacterium terrae]NRF66619.1 STAS domain-containing protein [Aquabacterium terrae]
MSIALPAVLTIAEARATVERLVAALAAENQPVLDASGLQTLDSAAIAVLLECRRAAQAAGKTLQLVGAPPKLGELARLYGVDGLLA